jgi:hypothetical protein
MAWTPKTHSDSFVLTYTNLPSVSAKSTTFLKNNQKNSGGTMVSHRNSRENQGVTTRTGEKMAKGGKGRAQIKFNFSKDFHERFLAEVERRHLKPAILATLILERWLEQPTIIQSLFLEGFRGLPQEFHKGLLEYLANQRNTGSAPEGFADRERRKLGDGGEEKTKAS